VTVDEKLAALRSILEAHAPLLVAYSGGVDSACLLAFATQTLGERVQGVIADSASLPRAALREAIENAAEFGSTVEVIRTEEFDNPAYVANPVNRCYFCKAELFTQMEALARDRGCLAIAYGENADDPAHLRPGSQAAAEFSVIAPLKAAGLRKADVRELARHLGLKNADAPAQPCLSSRIPHGVPVTPDALALVEAGEAAIRALGFRVFRVRYLPGPPPAARLQVAPDEFGQLDVQRAAIGVALRTAGFSDFEIDEAGYRSPA